jgi:hypothetical protein
MKIKILLFAVAAALLIHPSANAQDAGGIGDAEECIRLRDIDQTPAIDEQTILVKMHGGAEFKRIDLIGSCPGLMMSGFTHTTPEDRLCRSDPLRVRQQGGVTCKIDKIVNIDEAEAKELEEKRR